jgi:hypothetical protein
MWDPFQTILRLLFTSRSREYISVKYVVGSIVVGVEPEGMLGGSI